MGDPLSVAASTAGILSLGLQVCGGLINYCRAWKSHDRDIEEALDNLTDLESTLKLLSGILSEVESLEDNNADTLAGARDSIRSCTAALNKLHGILIESEAIDQPAGVLDKLHNVKLRSMFWFNKQKLKGLRASVSETQNNLGSAVQTLSLHRVIKQNVALGGLTTDTRDRIDQIPGTVEQALIKHFNQIPGTVEQALVRHLDQYGRRLSVLQQDILNASSQQIQTMQQVTQSISALQLGMIQKPSLIQAAFEEEQRLQSQQMKARSRSLQRCKCQTVIKYKPYRSPRLRRVEGSAPAQWNAAAVASRLVHRRDCPLFHDAEESKQFGLRISFSGPLLRGVIQAAISMTRGAGGFSISPMLAFFPIVSSGTGPFKIMDIIPGYNYTSAAGLQAIFTFRKQQLSRLYQEGKASPRDIDEDGNTVLHKACKMMMEVPYNNSKTDSNTGELYFQFLSDLYELGVPLNNMNAAGLTPLGEFVTTSINKFETTFLTLMSLKMLEIGAELPLLSQDKIRTAESTILSLGREFTSCPDLAEAFGCGEISQAVLAKSPRRLTAALGRRTESVNQRNALGQTPLHFSVEWPETISLLLDAGADVDAADNIGLTPILYAAKLFLLESFNILGETQCELRKFTSRSSIQPETLLEDMVKNSPYFYLSRDGFSDDKYDAMFDAAIRLLAERRRMLEALVRTSLDAKATQQLRLSSETVLDHKASLAISMLREKINVPGSLVTVPLSYRSGSTVYHIRGLNLRQAHVLWDNGFRDVNELDSVGRSALMKSGRFAFSVPNYTMEDLKIAAWLVEKGADLHCQQRHAFQKRTAKDRYYPGDEYGEDCITNRASSATALHYLASHLGDLFCHPTFMMRVASHNIIALSGKAGRLVRAMLTNNLPDCCTCACSLEGCGAYTMMMKRHMMSLRRSYGRIDLRQALHLTRAIARWLNVDQASLAWLRSEMVRFNTFERLQLRHTCCRMDYFGEFYDQVICELDDEEKREIMEEQAEQLDKLEMLLAGFEDAYAELGLPFSAFLGGYWKDRMREVIREEVPIDHTALENIGVKLRRTGSSCSWSEEEEEEEEVGSPFSWSSEEEEDEEEEEEEG